MRFRTALTNVLQICNAAVLLLNKLAEVFAIEHVFCSTRHTKMNAEQRIQQTIDIFVQDLRALLAQAARERLISVLGGEKAPASRSSAQTSARTSQRPPKSGRRVRRSAEQLGEVQERVLAVLAKSPGLTSEQLQEAVGMQKHELQRPLQLLRDEHKIRTTGQKRAMRYFPGAGKAGVVRRRSKAAE
jgi:predicted HTH transcriptional regulator